MVGIRGSKMSLIENLANENRPFFTEVYKKFENIAEKVLLYDSVIPGIEEDFSNIRNNNMCSFPFLLFYYQKITPLFEDQKILIENPEPAIIYWSEKDKEKIKYKTNIYRLSTYLFHPEDIVKYVKEHQIIPLVFEEKELNSTQVQLKEMYGDLFQSEKVIEFMGSNLLIENKEEYFEYLKEVSHKQNELDVIVNPENIFQINDLIKEIKEENPQIKIYVYNIPFLYFYYDELKNDILNIINNNDVTVVIEGNLLHYIELLKDYYNRFGNLKVKHIFGDITFIEEKEIEKILSSPQRTFELLSLLNYRILLFFYYAMKHKGSIFGITEESDFHIALIDMVLSMVNVDNAVKKNIINTIIKSGPFTKKDLEEVFISYHLYQKQHNTDISILFNNSQSFTNLQLTLDKEIRDLLLQFKDNLADIFTLYYWETMLPYISWHYMYSIDRSKKVDIENLKPFLFIKDKNTWEKLFYIIDKQYSRGEFNEEVFLELVEEMFLAGMEKVEMFVSYIVNSSHLNDEVKINLLELILLYPSVNPIINFLPSRDVNYWNLLSLMFDVIPEVVIKIINIAKKTIPQSVELIEDKRLIYYFVSDKETEDFEL